MKTFSRATHLIIGLALPALLLVALPASAQAEEWRQVGVFHSDGGNVSVGDARVRVITNVVVPREILDPGMLADTAAIQKLYPGWDYHSSLEMLFALTSKGFRQAGYLYSIGNERTPLPEDTIPATYAVFDLKNSWAASVPDDLRAVIGAGVPIKVARRANLDSDPDPEWVIVVADPTRQEGRGTRLKVSLLDHVTEGWRALAVFTLDDPSVAGPLEIRDMTGDGKPDVIFRTFRETEGHFWIEARIYSTHEGLPSMLDAAPLHPEPASR